LQIDFINTIEGLAKSPHIRSGDIDSYTEEILKESSFVLNCERTNAWVFNDKENVLISLNSFRSSINTFKVEGDLKELELPNYFNYLKKGEIIVSNDARKAKINSELMSIYIDPLKITAMIDVPIRSEGEMIGVICFEHVDKQHEWTMEEQKFTQSVAQLLSLALETNKKRIYREKLEKTITEKELLIAEVNHRVKNNMSVIISLLKLQKLKNRDVNISDLFDEVINKVYSMSAIQDRLHMSQDFKEIDLKIYVKDLVKNLNETYGTEKTIKIKLNLSKVFIDITKAVPFGLIVNEVLTNSFKYAFNEKNNSPELEIDLFSKNEKTYIRIKDNGPGMKKTALSKGGMGHEIIQNLNKQIEGEITFNSTDGVEMNLIF